MPLIVFLLIFLNACGIVHVEIRDRSEQRKVQTREKRGTPSGEERSEVKQEVHRWKEREVQKQTLAMQPPVKGKANPTERGYHIATSCGEFFRSVSEGRVLYAGDDIRGYGWVVMVEGEDGLVYVYGKGESSLVKRGEKVKKGQPLGRVGRTQEGCGLLFEIRDREGRPVSFELVL
ncbi:MAG: M23 family metallopeptidase [Aquificaceae bacterium]|nr:M23 family metallopeptidase [Aquificaceae bacterium]